MVKDNEIWDELATLIKDLPVDQRQRFQRGLAMFVHDLRQSIGIIYSAESLLRKKIDKETGAEELLDVIHTSSQRAIGLLTDFARPLDGTITQPVSRPPQDDQE